MTNIFRLISFLSMIIVAVPAIATKPTSDCETALQALLRARFLEEQADFSGDFNPAALDRLGRELDEREAQLNISGTSADMSQAQQDVQEARARDQVDKAQRQSEESKFDSYIEVFNFPHNDGHFGNDPFSYDGSSFTVLKDKRTVMIVDTLSGKERFEVKMDGFTAVTHLRWSQDNSTLTVVAMACSVDSRNRGYMKVFNANDGSLISKKTDPNYIVMAPLENAAGRPDRSAILTVNMKGYISIVEPGQDEPILRFQYLSSEGAPAKILRFSPDGRKIVALFSNEIHFFNASNGKLVDSIGLNFEGQEIYFRPGGDDLAVIGEENLSIFRRSAPL